MNRILIIGLFLLGTSLQANDSLPPLAIASYGAAESPVSITIPAQYLAAQVRIKSDEEAWSPRIANLADTHRLLKATVEKVGYKLRVDEVSIFQNRFFNFSSSFSSRGSNLGLSNVFILAPLDEHSDFNGIVTKCEEIIATLKPTKKISVALGTFHLALENPEELRPALLKKIRSHIEASAKILSDSPDYLITGLDGPVHLRQVGERELEASLPFRVTYLQKK